MVLVIIIAIVFAIFMILNAYLFEQERSKRISLQAELRSKEWDYELLQEKYFQLAPEKKKTPKPRKKKKVLTEESSGNMNRFKDL